MCALITLAEREYTYFLRPRQNTHRKQIPEGKSLAGYLLV